MYEVIKLMILAITQNDFLTDLHMYGCMFVKQNAYNLA